MGGPAKQYGGLFDAAGGRFRRFRLIRYDCASRQSATATPLPRQARARARLTTAALVAVRALTTSALGIALTLATSDAAKWPGVAAALPSLRLVAILARWWPLLCWPSYAPELNPVEGLWANLKVVELANLAADRLEEVTAAAVRGIQRIRRSHCWPSRSAALRPVAMVSMFPERANLS